MTKKNTAQSIVCINDHPAENVIFHHKCFYYFLLIQNSKLYADDEAPTSTTQHKLKLSLWIIYWNK